MNASEGTTSPSYATFSNEEDIREFNRASSLATYRKHQPWSIPDSVIYYISKNPSSAKCYEKISQSCKYFFIKNPILVAYNFCFIKNTPFTSLFGKSINFKNDSTKLWIAHELCVHSNHDSSYNPSQKISMIYQCDVKDLTLWGPLTISFKDFKFLSSKCEMINLYLVTVTHESGSQVAFEKIVEVLPYIRDFEHTKYDGSTGITAKTVLELLKIPHFLNLNYFDLCCIPEDFDIDTFCEYFKKNKKTKINLNFFAQLSNPYSTRLQAIVNDIIATTNHDYKIPLIEFPDIERSSYTKLFKLYMPC